MSHIFLLLCIINASAFKMSKKEIQYSWKSRLDMAISKLPSIEGIQIKGAQIANINGLRGVISTTAIVPNNAVVEVNSELVLQVANNREATPFPDFCSLGLWEDMKWDERLAVKLLHLKHKTKDGPLAQWISELPISFSTPLTWTEEEKNELQYSVLTEKIDIQTKKWKALYERWSIDSNTGISYNELVWGLQCVNSRAFSGPFEGSTANERRSLLAFTGILTVIWPVAGFGSLEDAISAAFVVVLSILLRDIISLRVSKLKRYVICPFVDMFNHKSTCESDASYNYFTGQFQLFTGSYAAGEQIYVSYGKQSNDRLLQYYGFTEVDNPNDIYDFNCGFVELLFKYADDLSATVSFPPFPEPKIRLEKIASALRGIQIQSSDDQNISTQSVISAIDFKSRYMRTSPSAASKRSKTDSVEDILARSRALKSDVISHFDNVTVRSLRAFLCSEQEWSALESASSFSSLKGLEMPLSQETELKIEQALRRIAQLELDSMPTTLEQDEAALEELLTGKPPADKGFSGKSSKKKPAAVATTAAPSSSWVDPSGQFRDTQFAALSFRIEKKKLLRAAAAK